MEMDRSIADSTKDTVSAFVRMSEVRLVKYRREAEINDVDRVILLAKRNNDIINAPRDASDGSTASLTRRTSGARNTCRAPAAANSWVEPSAHSPHNKPFAYRGGLPAVG